MCSLSPSRWSFSGTSLQIYREWANSVLCEGGLQIGSIADLASPTLLCQLYSLLSQSEVNALPRLCLQQMYAACVTARGCLCFYYRHIISEFCIQLHDICLPTIYTILYPSMFFCSENVDPQLLSIKPPAWLSALMLKSRVEILF